MLNGEFKIQLNSFSILTRKSHGWTGKKLRFTITLTCALPPVNPEIGDVEEELRVDIKGCLAQLNVKGELSWHPPQARNGSWIGNIIICSPALDKRVKAAIAGSEKFMAMLNTGTMPPKQMDPRIFDPDAPVMLDA